MFIHHFLQDVADELGHDRPEISPAAVQKLQQYHWPGNIRQLRHVLRQAAYHVLLIEGRCRIEPEDIQLPNMDAEPLPPASTKPEASEANGDLANEAEIIARALRQTKGNVSRAAKLLRVGRTTLYRKMKQYPELSNIRNET